MPWSGGTYTRSNGTYTGATVWQQDEANGYDIASLRHDGHDQDLATGINSTLNKAGQNSPTADISWGGFKITSLGSSTTRAGAMNVGQLQDGAAIWGGTSGGSANAQTITLTPAITAYVAGMIVRFRAGFTNTSTVTLNVNGVAAGTIKLSDGTSVKAGQIILNAVYSVVYDTVSSSWILMNPEAQASLTYTPTITASGAMTITSQTINYANYRVSGLRCDLNIQATVQCGGTASATILIPLPLTAIGSQPPPGAPGLTEGATLKSAAVSLSSTTVIAVQKYDSSNFSLATSIILHINGSYYLA